MRPILLRTTTLPLLLLLPLGCTPQPSGSDAPRSEERARADQAAPGEPAASPEAPAAPDLAALEGTWARDDGPRYLLVALDGRLVGQRLDPDDLGCRVALEPAADQLAGRACFTRRADEAGLLTTRWELRQVTRDQLAGRVEGVDLDEAGQEVGRTWELHQWRRESGLEPAEAEAARRIAAAQQRIDAALESGERQALLALFRSEEVRALERETPGREVVGERLVALAAGLREASPSDAGALPASTPREPAGEDEPAGEEALTLAPLPLHPWLPLVLDAPEGSELVGSEGAASISLGEGFALNVVEDAECGSGQGMIPEPFRDGIRGVEVDRPEEVLWRQDHEGEEGWSLELRIELGGRVYHAFSDRFTAFRREQVEAMRAAARSLRLTPQAAAAAEAAVAAEAAAAAGEPDMEGFLARMDGTAAGVEAALAAYERPGLERHGMDWYDLREPQVVAKAQEGNHHRFTLETKAGITIRTWVLVWEGSRIVEVIEGEVR